MKEIERYRVELSNCNHCRHEPSDTNWCSANQINLDWLCAACNIGISKVTGIIQKLTIQVDKGWSDEDEQVHVRHAN